MQYLLPSESVCFSLFLTLEMIPRLSASKTSQIFSSQKETNKQRKHIHFEVANEQQTITRAKKKNCQLFALEFITNGYKRFALEWLTRLGTFNNNKIKRKVRNKRR